MKKEFCILSYNSKTSTWEDLAIKLAENGFDVREHSVSIEGYSFGIMHAKKIIHRLGAHIEHYIAFNWDPSCITLQKVINVLDNEVRKIILKSEKERHLGIVRQRYIVYCLYGNNLDENDLKSYISNFGFDYSLFLPVVIDTLKLKVFHAMIPINVAFAKGKAISSLKKSVTKLLYSDEQIIRSSCVSSNNFKHQINI